MADERIGYCEGELDDVVLNAESVHMEVLSDKCLWIGITPKGGTERFTFTVTSDRKINLNLIEGVLKEAVEV